MSMSAGRAPPKSENLYLTVSSFVWNLGRAGSTSGGRVESMTMYLLLTCLCEINYQLIKRYLICPALMSLTLLAARELVCA